MTIMYSLPRMPLLIYSRLTILNETAYLIKKKIISNSQPILLVNLISLEQKICLKYIQAFRLRQKYKILQTNTLRA